MNRWTKEETQYLIDNVELSSYDEISKVLNKTQISVSKKAHRLGYNKSPERWTKEDDKFLIENYIHFDTDILAEKLNRTKNSILIRARQLKIKKFQLFNIGDEFNYFTIIENGFLEDGKTQYKCKCKCGIIKNIPHHSLKSGTTKSCGCYNRELASNRMKSLNKDKEHGLTGHPLYNSWKSMKTRCYNKNSNDYLGLEIYKSWNNFKNFYDWAILIWKEGYSLTRKIDNIGFFPDNCYFIQSGNIGSENLKIAHQINKDNNYCFTQTPEVQKKRKATNVKKYGTEYPQQSEEIKKKIVTTSLEKYGVTHASKSDIVKEITKNNNIEKYGVDYPQQLDENREKFRQLTIDRGQANVYNGKTGSQIAIELGRNISWFNKHVSQYGFEFAISMEPNRSGIEILIQSILEKHNIQFSNNKKLGVNYTDFILEDYKLVIESDGLYWHSDAINKNNQYHKNKKNNYNKLGYDSVFFREDEITKKLDIVESIILNKIHKSNRIFARKCKIVEVKYQIGKEFLKNNHLMENGKGKIFGLEYNNKLVTCIQITNKKEFIDISRFCHVLNTTVIGGFSRLIKHIDNIYNKDIQTFIDQRYGSGGYLENLGFSFASNFISFKWVKDDKTFHRMKFPGNTGYDNGLYKIWDCGQVKYIKKKTHILNGSS